MSHVGKSPKLFFCEREIASIFWHHWLYELVVCIFRQHNEEINNSRVMYELFTLIQK